MADDKEVFDALCAMIVTRIPAFKIRFKTDVWYEQVFGWLEKPFNPGYLTHYITTLGTNVDFPSKASLERSYASDWRVLAHEYVHLWRSNQNPIAYVLKYAFPPVLALISLFAFGAFWSPWFLLSLLGLLALIPWPVLTGRADEEYRAFAMGLAIEYWTGGEEAMLREAEWMVPQFTGSMYFFMWPNASALRSRQMVTMAAIRGGHFTSTDTAYSDVFKVLVKLGVIQDQEPARA